MTRKRIPLEERCSKLVYKSGSYSAYQCERRFKNTENGRVYCNQHTPSIRKAKQDMAYIEMKKGWERSTLLARTERRLILAAMDAYSAKAILPHTLLGACMDYRKARE